MEEFLSASMKGRRYDVEAIQELPRPFICFDWWCWYGFVYIWLSIATAATVPCVVPACCSSVHPRLYLNDLESPCSCTHLTPLVFFINTMFLRPHSVLIRTPTSIHNRLSIFRPTYLHCCRLHNNLPPA